MAAHGAPARELNRAIGVDALVAFHRRTPHIVSRSEAGARRGHDGDRVRQPGRPERSRRNILRAGSRPETTKGPPERALRSIRSR